MPGLPPSVRHSAGRGGLPRLTLDGPGGSAEVYLHGAQVTAWAPAGGEPVLWLSAAARFAAGAAIRGGVPICFPWFGALESHPAAPAHGFARVRPWELVDAQERGDDVAVTLRLTADETTRSSPWPHRFEALCTVTAGRSLTVGLTVTNRDDREIRFEEALHTYLRVPDVQEVTVLGLESAPFLDRLAGPGTRGAEGEPLIVGAEVDRIYLPTDATVTVQTPARTLAVGKQGSAATVVWNPWSERSAAMADMGDDGWRTMLCVEAANVRGAAVSLAPGASHTLTTTIRVEDRIPGGAGHLPGS